MPSNPKTTIGSFRNVSPVVFYAVMLCLLIPIGAFAILGTQNARPTRLFYWHALTGEQPHLLAFENGPTKAKIYCVDLKNRSMTTAQLVGRISSFPSVGNFNTQVWAHSYKTEEGGALQLIEMQANEATKIPPIQLTDLENSQSPCVVDNHIVRLQQLNLESIGFVSGTASDSIPCPTLASHIEQILDTKSFLVSGPPYWARKEPQQFLFGVSDGKLTQTAAWSDIHHYQFKVASQSYIVSLLIDGVSLEVRNATTGDVVSRYVIPRVPTLPTTITSIDTMSHGKSWIHWRRDPLLYTDALTGTTLPVPVGSFLIERDLAGNRLVTMIERTDFSSGWDCIVLDGTTGVELNRFEVAPGLNCPVRSVNHGVFMIDANQMVFATQDCRFFTYDISSGKLIRSFEPLYWFDWCSRLAAIAYGIWCFVWLCVSPKLHPYGWVDLAICSGLVVAFCWYQLQYNVDPRYSFFVLFGIFGSWTLTAVTWLVFGRIRWSLRMQPLILIVGITTGIIALATTREQAVLALFVVGLFLLVIAYLFALLPLRFLRFQFKNDSILENSVDKILKHRSSAVALRDVFLLTMVCALLFAVARWLPAADWSQTRHWDQTSILVSVIAIPSLLGFWTAIGRSSWFARWGVWAFLIIGVETLYRNGFIDSVPWDRTLSAATTTLFCFYAYRLRGWRLRS